MMQGWDNFRKEAKQLRRSFRFNEYKEIRAQNPPRNFFTRVCLPIESTQHTLTWYPWLTGKALLHSQMQARLYILLLDCAGQCRQMRKP